MAYSLFVSEIKFVAIQLKCIILRNTMQYAITVHLKMLAVKYQQMCIHCAVANCINSKDHISREVNNTFKYMANL